MEDLDSISALGRSPEGGHGICFVLFYGNSRASLVAQMAKNLPEIQETQVRSLEEDPLK